VIVQSHIPLFFRIKCNAAVRSIVALSVVSGSRFVGIVVLPCPTTYQSQGHVESDLCPQFAITCATDIAAPKLWQRHQGMTTALGRERSSFLDGVVEPCSRADLFFAGQRLGNLSAYFPVPSAISPLSVGSFQWAYNGSLDYNSPYRPDALEL
jgi:hypothetical protein